MYIYLVMFYVSSCVFACIRYDIHTITLQDNKQFRENAYICFIWPGSVSYEHVKEVNIDCAHTEQYEAIMGVTESSSAG